MSERMVNETARVRSDVLVGAVICVLSAAVIAAIQAAEFVIDESSEGGRKSATRPMALKLLLYDGKELKEFIKMAWTVPEYSRNEVDAAGRTLFKQPSGDVLEHALTVINNWRSSHSFPLNTFQMGLRDKSKRVDQNSLVAQRIKRLSSIYHKLDRFSTMKLSQMQDIGGCRAVVRSVRHVDGLVDLYRGSKIKHRLVDIDDYIRSPRGSGYRGVHLIYRYYSDRNETYNGLKIEMQLRSPLQHAWATAVETVGTFVQQALKSSLGEEEWLRFFALMGTAIAYREKTPAVGGTPTDRKELIGELRYYATQLDVVKRLQAYGAALRTSESPGAEGSHFFLLELNSGAGIVTVSGYNKAHLGMATKDYLAAERQIADLPGAEAVLVSVESLASLRRAYPNYFLDTEVFLEALRVALKK